MSSLPNDRKGSLIHYMAVLAVQPVLRVLEATNFDFSKYINFRNTDGRTPFLQFCDSASHYHGDHNMNYFITNIWKQYAHSDCDGFETDNDGNNGLHLMVQHIATDNCDTLRFILETVFFSNNNPKSTKGIAALNQQNKNGDTPLHIALRNDDNQSAYYIAKLLLKYECDVATKYNKKGYLPIHIACKHNNWKALAV